MKQIKRRSKSMISTSILSDDASRGQSKLQKSSRRAKERVTKAQALMDLLALSKRTDQTVQAGRFTVDMKRESLITTESNLVRRWGWNRAKLRTFLREIVTEDFYTSSVPNSKKPLIRIIRHSVLPLKRP